MDVARNTLYFADVSNRRIRAVDLSTGLIRTVAGGGTADIGDGGPATSATFSTHPMRVMVNDDDALFVTARTRTGSVASTPTRRSSAPSPATAPRASGATVDPQLRRACQYLTGPASIAPETCTSPTRRTIGSAASTVSRVT